MTSFKAGKRVRVRAVVPGFGSLTGTVVRVTGDGMANVKLDKWPKGEPRRFKDADKKNVVRLLPQHCDEI